MKRLALSVVLVSGMAGPALADDIIGNIGDVFTVDAPANPLITPWSRPQPTYVLQDPGLSSYDGADSVNLVPNASHVIYLNNCKPAGCPINPGDNNSTSNPPTSIIPEQQSVVQPFAYSDDVWQQVVNCVRQSYGPFEVQITDVRPTSGDYHMAIVAGNPGDVQMPNGVGGVSPFTCSYIQNAVSFSFSNVYGGDVNQICWTVAQETAHSWGLDHKFDNRDPMTYLSSGPARKVFQNEAGRCGEFSARDCQCGGATMNAYQAIVDTFGAAPPTPPVVGITSPAEGETVAASFPVRATITDDILVTKAELYIDNHLVSSLLKFPYVWNAPPSVGQGRHRVKVKGYDVANTPAELEVHVTLGKACKKGSDCDKDGDACVDGRCVAGSGVQGGLGTTCVMNSECSSGQCGADAEGNHFCVESCEPALDGCPSGFQCLASGVEGVCWPGGDDGGCSTSSGGSSATALVFLGLAGFLLRRRRR